MNKGIIYVMSTVVPGILKIGQTQIDQYENRMRFLENNGYANITGLKREFAIEVENYQEKEKMIHNIFNKSRVYTTELFALDLDTIIQLLSSFEGVQIYPKDLKKSELFEEITKEIEDKEGVNTIPNGKYYLRRTVKDFGKVNGTMKVEDGKLTILKGSICATVGKQKVPKLRKEANIKDNILQEDIVCNSPSTAGYIILARSNNGWIEWKNSKGEALEKFRVFERTNKK